MGNYINTLTLLSFIGGRTTVFSKMRITIFHNSLSKRFKTVFSHDSAYNDNDPGKKFSISCISYRTYIYFVQRFSPSFRNLKLIPQTASITILL